MLKKIFCKLKADSLSRQLLYWILAVVVFILGVNTIFQYILLKNTLFETAKHLLQSRLHNVEIGELIEADTPEAVQKKAFDFVNRMMDTQVSVIIIHKNGEIIMESEKENRVSYGKRLLKEEDTNSNLDILTPKLSQDEYRKLIDIKGIIEETTFAMNSQGEKFMIQFSKVGHPADSSGLIQLSTAVTPIENALKQHIFNSAILAAFVFLISILLIQRLLHKTLKPLNTITDTILEINVGKLSLRLPEKYYQIEMNKLSTAFNGMLERIENSFQKENAMKEKMKQFLSDASHELKTPITAIHGFAEVLNMGAAKDEKQVQASLKTIMSESERLTRLLNNLLLITRLDQDYKVEMTLEQLGIMLEELRPQLQMMVGIKMLEIEIKEDLVVQANRDQIKQVILNILQNAVKFTPEDTGRIKITLQTITQEDGKYAQLIIADNGMGIPKESLNTIFDRFFRVESHRSRNKGGYGLGLSIVKQIVQQHGGEINVESEEGKGTVFSLYFKGVV